MQEGYIAFLDSGIGGISVLAAAKKALPDEDFLYFGDLASAPYGDKSAAEVLEIVRKQVKYLQNWPLKALVLACNTATSAGADELRVELDIPVFGVEPALKPAVKESFSGVLVLATALTLREKKFRLLMEKMDQTKEIIPLACPGLMELVEENPHSLEAKAALEALIAPHEKAIGAIVLGCTHYAFLKPWLEKLYPHIQLFDGHEGLARNLTRVLTEKELLGGHGQILWLSSLEDADLHEAFIEKCWKFYEMAL